LGFFCGDSLIIVLLCLPYNYEVLFAESALLLSSNARLMNMDSVCVLQSTGLFCGKRPIIQEVGETNEYGNCCFQTIIRLLLWKATRN